MIYIVRQNISSRQGLYYSSIGRLERVARGVYVDARIPFEERRKAVIEHSARIANHLFPDLAFSFASAYHCQAVNGEFFLARRLWRAPIETPYININFQIIDSPYGIPMNTIKVADSMGTFLANVVSDEILILQAFARVSEKNRKNHVVLSIDEIAAITRKAIKKVGGVEKLIERMQLVAENVGMRSNLKRAIDFIKLMSPELKERKYISGYDIYWHDRHVGTLRNDGKEWEYQEYEGYAKLSSYAGVNDDRGVSPLVVSLMPESAIGRNGLNAIKDAGRYLSNITVRKYGVPEPIITECLDGKISDWINYSGQFHGEIMGFPENMTYFDIVQMNSDAKITSIPGMQLKLAMNLSESGFLTPAIGKPCTHIVKFPSPGASNSLGSNEWYVMSLAGMCGIDVPDFAVADVIGNGPCMIVERFDIRKDKDDRSYILSEDFCSVMNVPSDKKYDADYIHVCERIAALSSDPVEDGRKLIRQILFSWLVGNGDLHLKNLSLIKIATRNLMEFDTVRLSPAYDLLSTALYMKDNGVGMPLAGSHTVTVDGLKRLGAALGVSASEVVEIARKMLLDIKTSAEVLIHRLPPIIIDHKQAGMENGTQISLEHINRISAMIAARSALIDAEILAQKKPAKKK